MFQNTVSAARWVRTLVTMTVTGAVLVTTSGAAQPEPPMIEIERLLTEHGLAPSGSPEFSSDGVARGLDVEAVVADDATLRVTQPGSQDFIELSPRGSERSSAQTDGSFVTFDVEGGTTAVQSLPTGGRIVEVIDETADPVVEFVYDVAVPSDVRLVEGQDGTIAAVRESATATTASLQVVGEIKSPWALDADGIPQPVAYSLEGTTLTMTVTPNAGATYPIVADPEATVGDFKFTWKLTSPHIVTAHANKRGSGAINIGSGALCAAVALVPVVGPAVSVVCFANEAILGIGQLYGKCQWVKFNAIGNPKISKGLYSGGFCK